MDNQPQPDAAGTQPAPAAPVQKTTRTGRVWLVIAILLFVLASAGGFQVYRSSKQLKDKDSELASVRSELESSNQQLAQAQEKIESLDSPEKKANDAKRKSDLARFITALNEYASNRDGRYPTTEPTLFADQFERVYITGGLANFIDPNTRQAYKLIPVANVQTPPGVTLGTIQYQWPGKCAGSEFDDDATSRQAAARMILESGEIYCLDT